MEDVEVRHVEVAQLHAEIRELRGEFTEFRESMRGELSALRLEIKEAKYDLIKWSFLFWVGAVMSIAVLAGVLRSIP